MKYSIFAIVCMLVLPASMLLLPFRNQPLQVSSSRIVVCCHQSYFSQPGFYEQAYKDANYLETQTTPTMSLKEGEGAARGIIVNHHLLAASFIAESFDVVATTAPVTVLLVSPNHFDAGKGNIITSAEEWQTPYGKLQPDSALIQQLADSNSVNVEEDPFIQEHGISGIVPFIKKSLPNAKVIPLIFRNRMTLAQSLASADGIFTKLPADTLAVGSFDFSHYLPSRAADFHDLESLNAVQSFDFPSIYNLDIDSRPGLSFYLELLKNFGVQKFELLEHSNSAKLTRQDVLETTSYITGYFEKGSVTSSSVQTLLSLPPVVATSSAESLVNKRLPSYGLTYMERFFYGQDKAVSFLSGEDSFVQSSLRKLGMTFEDAPSSAHQLGPKKVQIAKCVSDQAYVYVDKGADAVVCQGADTNKIEMYKNKPIVYAAGNFLQPNPKKESMAVGLAYTQNKLQIYLLPMGIKDGQIMLLVGSKNDTLLVEMAQKSEVSAEIKNEIKNGVLNIQFNK